MIIRKGAPKINSGAPPASCTPWLLPDFFRDYPVDNLAKAGEYLFDSAEPVDGDIFALPRIMVGDDGCLCLVDVYPVADDSFVGIVRPAAALRRSREINSSSGTSSDIITSTLSERFSIITSNVSA